MAKLTVSNLAKSFGATPVLRDVDLAVESGEIVCLLGPSGCGKTTLLRIVAGLEQADQGQLLLDGADLTRIPVHKRGFGLMFQEFALFPDKSVGENVAFGLHMQGVDRRAVQQRVQESLALVDLAGYESRSVFALSGGERQRVALARSLAPRPRLLMLDEPLGSLDRSLREGLMLELRRILKEVGVTALYVTHDQQEAFALADRVAVMNQGRLEQVAPPEQVYARPATLFVARFLGLNNLLPVHRMEGNRIETPLGSFQLSAGHDQNRKQIESESRERPSQKNPPLSAPSASHPFLLIRPECDSASLGQEGESGQIAGEVRGVSFRGSDYRLALTAQGGDGKAYALSFTIPTRHRGRLHLPTIGQQIRLGVDSSQLVVLRDP
jgi:ABC-type Fe3+/spermidine/putrescine transport system ATPase subunit